MLIWVLIQFYTNICVVIQNISLGTSKYAEYSKHLQVVLITHFV